MPGLRGISRDAPGKAASAERSSGPATSPRFVALLLLVLAAALGIRLIYVAAVTNHDHHFYDAYWYEFEAVTIGNGQGVINPVFNQPDRPNADHPPLTSVVLVPISKLTDGTQLAMKLTMAVLGTVGVLAIALIAREIAGDRAALIAAVLAAVYPNLWINDGLIMAETLSALLVAVAILLAYKLLRRPRWGTVIVLGIVCGLAVLTRAELGLLIPFVALPACLAAAARTSGRRIAFAGAVVLVAALTVSPWVIRNLTTFDRPVYLSSGDGLVLAGANCKSSYSGSTIGLWDLHCAEDQLDGPGDVSVTSSRQRHEALDYMRAHPGRLALTAVARVGRVWSVYAPVQTAELAKGEGRPEALSLVGVATLYLLFPVAVAGAFVLRRRRVAVFPLHGTFAIVTLTAVAFYGWTRFRVPAEVAIVVLAAVALDSWFFERRRQAPRVEPAS